MNEVQKKSIFLILLLLVLSLSSCQNENTNEKSSINKTNSEKNENNTGSNVKSNSLESKSYETYTNDKDGFEIQYPSDYKKQEGLMGTTVFLGSPLENADDTFSDNFNFVVQDLSSQPMTLEDYAKLSEIQINQIFTDVKITKSEKFTLDGEKAYKFEYTGKEGKFELAWLQAVYIKDNKAYILTFTSESSKYDKYKDVFQKMLDSFKISK